MHACAPLVGAAHALQKTKAAPTTAGTARTSVYILLCCGGGVNMGNEELALMIQAGHTEHYGELWERCRKLLFAILRQKTRGLRLPNYITADDMEQEMYFALCRAVQAYNEAKPYSFNSYLDFSVMGAIRDFMPDTHITEYSYNQPIPNDQDSGETELLDLIADEDAPIGYEHAELTDLQQRVRQAVAELPRREGEAVRLYYLSGLTYKQIAERAGVSVEMIRTRKNKGIKILRRDRALYALHNEFEDHYMGVE